ncbi:hypothetical protein GN956_G25623 [Arapaima gigas]
MLGLNSLPSYTNMLMMFRPVLYWIRTNHLPCCTAVHTGSQHHTATGTTPGGAERPAAVNPGDQPQDLGGLAEEATGKISGQY